MKKITIKHSDNNGKEFGYGLYINAIGDGCVMASECLSRSASNEDIKAAERRVRKRGYYHLKRLEEKSAG